jgi:regulatory protein
MEKNRKRDFKKKYVPPVLTEEKLRFIALRYVSRYAACKGMLKKTLQRHMQKSKFLYPEHDHLPLESCVATLLESFENKGWVNDEGVAASIIRNGRANGLAQQKIAQKLQAKGISRDMIRMLLVESSDEESEWNAALTFIKRKRMGAFRTKDIDPKKEMARMCRAGFSPALARKALQFQGDED